MLRFQIALAIILVGCVAFVACERGQQMLDPADMTDPGTDPPMVDTETYKTWMSVMLDAPTMTVEEAAAAMNAGGTGAAHGMGTRTVYFDEAAAMANMAGTMYPAGATIVKEIMDDTNMFVQKIAKMTQTDDPMYADHGGWMYVKYARASETDAYMMVGGGSVEASVGCDGCHAKAGEGNYSVFVPLPMDQMMDDMTDMTTDDMDKPMDKQMFKITLTNLTMGVHGMSGQTFSPAIFAAHPAGIKLAEVGQPASEALVAQAEGGKTDGLEALVEAAGAYYMIAMNEDGSRRYTMPGQSSMVTLMADKMMNSSLSVSSMLVSTNDAFIAAIDVPLFDADGMPVTTTINLMAYDAGSENNTEMASDIPGPLGLDADADPAGSNARVPTEGGVIMAHPGIQGGGDVTEAFGWTEPIATLMITPVDASMGDDMDDMDDMGDDMDNGGAQ